MEEGLFFMKHAAQRRAVKGPCAEPSSSGFPKGFLGLQSPKHPPLSKRIPRSHSQELLLYLIASKLAEVILIFRRGLEKEYASWAHYSLKPNRDSTNKEEGRLDTEDAISWLCYIYFQRRVACPS